MNTDSTYDRRLIVAVGLMIGLVTLSTAGCSGDDATGPDGGETGQVSAQMEDAPDGGTGARNVAFSHASMSGSMSGNAKVQVSADGSTWVDLGSPKDVTMQLHTTGNTTSLHSEATVETGTYTRVRLVLEDASATLDAGSTIGTTLLDASVNLSIGGSSGRVVIEKQVDPVTVSAGSHATLAFDLNSAAWITEENVSARSVSEAEVRSATAVSVR